MKFKELKLNASGMLCPRRTVVVTHNINKLKERATTKIEKQEKSQKKETTTNPTTTKKI